MNSKTSLIAEATNIQTHPERLRELADKFYADNNAKNLGLSLASNPNTPLETLLQLGEKYPQQLLANPAFDLYLLSHLNLLTEIPENTLISIFKLPQAPPEYILYTLNYRRQAKILLTIISFQSEIFNRWRQDNHQINLSLTNANLENIDLSNGNFKGFNLSGANLKNANLSGCNLEKVNLENAKLTNCNLSNSNLKLAKLINANLINCNLSNSILCFSYLNNSNLTNADLRGVNLIGVMLNRANLTGIKINNQTKIDHSIRFAKTVIKKYKETFITTDNSIIKYLNSLI